MANETSTTKQNISETMEDAMNSMKHACELARNLEPKLANVSNNHLEMLLLSIDEVEKAFGASKEKLLMMMVSQQQQQTLLTSSSSSPFNAMLPIEVFKHETHTMEQLMLMQQQPLDLRGLIENKMMSGVDVNPQMLRYKGALHIGEMGVESSKGGSEGEIIMHGMEASPSRPRKSRKNDLEKKIKLFPAPLVGNTEIPQDDGFTWRKYGQKEILGSKHPRAYYRCTHQKLYGCLAKKQVQRLDENPNIFQVTYRGDHTCHMSSTAPSSFPPPPSQLLMDISKEMSQPTISPQLSPQSTSVSAWLSSANLSLRGSSGGAGPSTTRYGTADYPVADMADAMFNSSSSSGNSMESLFSPAEDKWEPSEKKS